MRLVQPKAYLVAKTSLIEEGIQNYIDDIGSPNWSIDKNVSDGENLIEAAGRMCYRSWQEYDENKPQGTNPNVKKIRKGNTDYIGNVLKQKHGSIFEHVSATFILKDVSRVFTHELVRHKAGTAYSQESLRYIRLDNLGFWIPKALRGNLEAVKIVKDVYAFLEGVQIKMSDLFNIDKISDFHTKKELTSAFRRLAPCGLATTIMVTGNLRAWRHIIETRTSEGAEEEIRMVISFVADILSKEYPNVFQDMSINEKNEYVFENKKV